MTPPKKNVMLTLPQRSALYALLQTHVTVTAGQAIYAAGWDDATVAAEVPGATASHVARIRNQHFGHLAPAGVGLEVAEMGDTLAGLREQVAVLEQRIEALERNSKVMATI